METRLGEDGRRDPGAGRSAAAPGLSRLADAGPFAGRRLALYLPAALVLASWIVWSYLSGGYFARDWYPAGIALVALLAVATFAGERVLPVAKPARVALIVLGAFVAWSYLSMIWAGSPGS